MTSSYFVPSNCACAIVRSDYSKASCKVSSNSWTVVVFSQLYTTRSLTPVNSRTILMHEIGVFLASGHKSSLHTSPTGQQK